MHLLQAIASKALCIMLFGWIALELLYIACRWVTNLARFAIRSVVAACVLQVMPHAAGEARSVGQDAQRAYEQVMNSFDVLRRKIVNDDPVLRGSARGVLENCNE